MKASKVSGSEPSYGIYAICISGLNDSLTPSNALYIAGTAVSYLGVSGLLSDRLQSHAIGPSSASSFRLSLYAILRKHSLITAGEPAENERRLSEFIDSRATFFWARCRYAFDLEKRILKTHRIPLNVVHQPAEERAQLTRLRSAYKIELL